MADKKEYTMAGWKDLMSAVLMVENWDYKMDDCSAALKGDPREVRKDDCWETLTADMMEDSMAHETVWSTAASMVESWDYKKDDYWAA